ncbi:phytanoyl-CoA dioxygenase family protein [Aestuariibacter salexigens]|uniref:phytanoyl-CoA dioxygenase family protein n=1 Tax=Aestuariibacter salexigens TaxID=226010 RepID=UPI00042350AD|nr:phytanoyl-CoA dioxygenase family protein [Aestuariibacter salexigens]
MKYLFGIGVEKCGTSSLFSMLDSHPLFNTSVNKETFFFSKHYQEGIESYLNLFKLNPLQFQGYSVDITPSYFRSPETLRRIQSFEAEKKILIMLRDPIKRAYSHYVHDVVHHISSGEKSHNFTKNIPVSFEQLIDRRPDYYLPAYSSLVENAFNVFGRHNVHIIKLEDLISCTTSTLQQLCLFLGINETELDSAKLLHSNERKIVPQIIAQLKLPSGHYNMVQQVSEKTVKTYRDVTFEQMSLALQQQENYSLSVSPTVIEKIVKHYQSDLKHLFDISGMTFEIHAQDYQLSASLSTPNYSRLDDIGRNTKPILANPVEAISGMKPTVKQITSKTAKLVEFLKTPDKAGRLRRKRKQNLRNLSLKNAKDYSEQGQWPKSPELQPWFDQPDAKAIIEDKHLNGDEKKLLEQWVDKGYVIADVLDGDICDQLKAEMENDIWGGQKRYPNLQIIGVRGKNEAEKQNLFQPDLLSLPEDQRRWMKLNSNWRIHGLDEHSERFERAAENGRILHIGSLLFGEKAQTGFTLSFGVGSQQTLHQDYAQFHIYPRNYLIGCWIALEDIHPDSGPLEFYPGTHKLGYWYKHDANYPQTNLRTSTDAEKAEYFAWLKNESEKLADRQELIIKKGQALFWHACLAHGGSKRKNNTLSRHSLVLHLVPQGFNVDKRLIVNLDDQN